MTVVLSSISLAGCFETEVLVRFVTLQTSASRDVRFPDQVFSGLIKSEVATDPTISMTLVKITHGSQLEQSPKTKG